MLHAPRTVPIPAPVHNDVQRYWDRCQDQEFGVVIKCKHNIGDLLSQIETGACPWHIPLRKMGSR